MLFKGSKSLLVAFLSAAAMCSAVSPELRYEDNSELSVDTRDVRVDDSLGIVTAAQACKVSLCIITKR